MQSASILSSERWTPVFKLTVRSPSPPISSGAALRTGIHHEAGSVFCTERKVTWLNSGSPSLPSPTLYFLYFLARQVPTSPGVPAACSRASGFGHGLGIPGGQLPGCQQGHIPWGFAASGFSAQGPGGGCAAWHILAWGARSPVDTHNPRLLAWCGSSPCA